MKLLSINQDAKTIKGMKRGWLTAIMYLAPHTLGGKLTVCPKSTPGCRDSIPHPLNDVEKCWDYLQSRRAQSCID